jgi:GNAT superfamily N-acetyltransferase
MKAPIDALAFRHATADDAADLAAVLIEGFDTYRAFAPEGWEPPAAEPVAEMLASRLGKPTVWCVLAEEGGRIAGYVSLLPAADARQPVGNPRLAHLWNLFVRSPWWGTGLAARLHREACEAAARRGFTAMRLFTPAEQSRARRFYEREHWTHVDGPYVDEELGLSVVEYRRALATDPSGARPS